MSNPVKQETGQGMGDDRDFFEEDFHGLVPGSIIELPEGYDVTLADFPCEIDPRFTAFLTRDITGEDVQRPAGATKPQKWSMRFEEADLGNVLPRDIQIEGVDGTFDYIGYVSRKQLDDDHTKETIADLQKNGIVTIVDGKTGTSIDAVAYHKATRRLDWGARWPYDQKDVTCNDWAHAAVRGVFDELRDRGGIGHALQEIDPAIREEIVDTLSDIVRAAFIRRSA